MVTFRQGFIWALLVNLFILPLHAQQNTTSGEAVTSTVKGVVIAARSWNVTPKASNLISHLHFIEGQSVRKGDLLVEFDTGLKALEVKLAEATHVRAGVLLDAAVDDLERQEKLKAREAVSLKSYRDAYFAVELAKAELETTKVQLEMASAILGAQKIHAPFDGRISAPLYRENAYVDLAEGTEIATIVSLDPIHVRAPVSIESILTRLRAGEFGKGFAEKIRIELKLSDGLVYKHSGQIVSIGVGIDPETGEGSLLISFPNPQGILRPGLPVLVTGYLD